MPSEEYFHLLNLARNSVKKTKHPNNSEGVMRSNNNKQ